jgi:hypothetical protein
MRPLAWELRLNGRPDLIRDELLGQVRVDEVVEAGPPYAMVTIPHGI